MLLKIIVTLYFKFRGGIQSDVRTNYLKVFMLCYTMNQCSSISLYISPINLIIIYMFFYKFFLQDDDWFDIYDPRNAMNKRRREKDANDGREKSRKEKMMKL